MRAVVMATGAGTHDSPLGSRRLLPMMPLLDRPFLQHLVERLVA
jgi:NDP-sugar pyrophosphorylase family protein